MERGQVGGWPGLSLRTIGGWPGLGSHYPSRGCPVLWRAFFLRDKGREAFRAHGGHTLSELLDDPHIFIQYYPKHIHPFGPSGKPALGANFPSSQDIYITPDGLGVGKPDLAGTIAHELLHRNKGGGGSEPEAEAAIEKCGILPSFLSLPSINVTVKPK